MHIQYNIEVIMTGRDWCGLHDLRHMPYTFAVQMRDMYEYTYGIPARIVKHH